MMGMEPAPSSSNWCVLAVAASALLGLGLIADQAVRMSATYDEVTYIQVGARWWRLGEQDSITRMGSPLTFWKVQQAPTLWLLDRLGFGTWIDEPIVHQEALLPLIRIGGSWIWLVALLVVANWARELDGPRAMVMASVLFALSPNLLAHGALSTMELPLVACSSAMFFFFWRFLKQRRGRDFWASAAVGGLAMSCKYTTILFPPILGLAWAMDLWLGRERDSGRLGSIVRTVVVGMVGFVAAMVVANLVVTGFATIPLSARDGSHPLLDGRLGPGWRRLADRIFAASFPQDWVGFATQVMHQRNGGPSYLLGERRMTGWTHYYLVCLAVKVPLSFWLLAIARPILGVRVGREQRGWFLPVILVAFLLAAMLGSKRNYGFRYLLPIACPAIVWTSGLAQGSRRSRMVGLMGLAGMALAVFSIHPHELTYFNELAGGPIGGRKVLADSNLDWGQGARSLARLQRARPEFRDLTLFSFGDTDPGYYGVEGGRIVFGANQPPADLPPSMAVETTYLAVSASLQWGPWGPPGYFKDLDDVAPIAYTDDRTIAIYRASDLRESRLKRGRGPG